MATSREMSSLQFTINRSWDDEKRHYNIDIKLVPEGDFIRFEIDSPFFGGINPGGEYGKPFPKLWEYEVVEAFFLGSDNMYLEVEFAPHGQHLLLFLAGSKNAIKMLLPLEYEAEIEGGKWFGTAKIPVGYFPPNVTLFNAYAIHGMGVARQYDALYPASAGLYEDPDFHRLHLFQPIDFNSLVKRDKQLSKEWKEALDENGIEYDEKVLNSPEK